jgi:hypothetical protein
MKVLKEGTIVSIEDTSVFSGQARVRVQGHADPIWVFSVWLD